MKDMQYGLIGEKLGHSFSKEVHAALADYDYRLVELSRDELDTFMRERSFKAINVTVPYKSAVIPYLDVVDDAAREIGAVNTVKRVGDKLYGYNTDVLGLRDLILRVLPAPDLCGKTVLILGSGGTSKTARAVCSSLGASEVVTVGRVARDGIVDYESAYRDFSHADLIVNTTPLGMYPEQDACPIDISRFTALSGVVDVVYNPLRTDLVLSAKKRGIPAEGGLYMLVSQAVHACEIFTETVIAPERVSAVFSDIRASKENIILVGMPGCGKSTVGRRLAAELGRPFIDTDELIVKRDGRPITQIFAENGELYFRELESSVIRDVCLQSRGAVIATGGGAVLREENVHALRRVGRIYFLDRDIENIRPTADRPLSLDREALSRRYRERYPIYCAACDLHLTPDESVNSRVQCIKKEFLSI